jgi:hypothetical protein
MFLVQVGFLSTSAWRCSCENCESAMTGMLCVTSRWKTSAPGGIFFVECMAAVQAEHAAVLRAVLMSIAALSTLCRGRACVNGRKVFVAV